MAHFYPQKLLILSSLLSIAASPIQAANADAATIQNSGIDLSNRAFLSFSSESGESYEVQSSENLEVWQSRTTLSGSGTTLSWTDSETLTDTRFFRVDAIQTSTSKLATGDVLTVTQSWSQATDYPRTASVTVPEGTGPHPVDRPPRQWW